MSRLLAALVAVVLVTGCGADDQAWQPVAIGSEWKYQIRAGLLTSVDALKVEHEVPVANHQGVSISGPGGETRLAWIDGALVADMMGGTRYAPPLPILIPGLKAKQTRTWSGLITTGHRSFGAEAEVRMQEDSYVLAERKTDAMRSDIRLEINQQTIEISSWFVRGVGMVRQEERTRDQLVRALEYVSGP